MLNVVFKPVFGGQVLLSRQNWSGPIWIWTCDPRNVRTVSTASAVYCAAQPSGKWSNWNHLLKASYLSGWSCDLRELKALSPLTLQPSMLLSTFWMQAHSSEATSNHRAAEAPTSQRLSLVRCNRRAYFKSVVYDNFCRLSVLTTQIIGQLVTDTSPLCGRSTLDTGQSWLRRVIY